MRAEKNTIENRKTIGKVNKTKSWFFGKINIIDKTSAGWTNLKRQVTNIRNESGNAQTNVTEIKRIIRQCYE